MLCLLFMKFYVILFKRNSIFYRWYSKRVIAFNFSVVFCIFYVFPVNFYTFSFVWWNSTISLSQWNSIFLLLNSMLFYGISINSTQLVDFFLCNSVLLSWYYTLFLQIFIISSTIILLLSTFFLWNSLIVNALFIIEFYVYYLFYSIIEFYTLHLHLWQNSPFFNDIVCFSTFSLWNSTFPSLTVKFYVFRVKFYDSIFLWCFMHFNEILRSWK